MPDWDEGIDIDESLVRALLGEQFPDLDADSVRFLGQGWDNLMWVVEEQWGFRFPRRDIAIPGVERELAALPRLAPLLPLPIPVPRFVGRPTDLYSWPFFGALLLPGVEPCDAGLEHSDRGELGTALGRFLRALHDIEPVIELPVDPLGRADMTVRLPRVRANLDSLRELGLWQPPDLVDEILGAADALPPSSAGPLQVHGDLHQRHLLFENGALAAVIDWGDTCRGDPCIDLVPFWSLLERAGRERFLAEYGPVSNEQLLRARVLALTLDSMLARYAQDVGYLSLQREAIAALERALAD
jgi:aminoglycoside phosphotransferase (APT) family kinase protein